MRKSSIALALVSLAAFASSASAFPIFNFELDLNGFNEVTAGGVPGQGDPDGTGHCLLAIDDSTAPFPTIDWNCTVADIALPLSGAHIHQAPSTTTGSVVVNFSAQISGSGLQDTDLSNVLANPTGFYVNFHNADFPSGAIRGQLPEPSTLCLLGFGALAVLRRRR